MIKAYPDRPVLGHDLTTVGLNSTSQMVNVTADIMASYPALVNEGFSGTAEVTHYAGKLIYKHPFTKLLENNSTAAINKAKAVMNKQIVDKWLPYNGTSLSVKSTFNTFDTFLGWYDSRSHTSAGHSRPMMASRFFDKKSMASQKKNMKSLLETLIAG